MRTVASVSATERTISSTLSMGGLWPTISEGITSSATFCRRRWFSLARKRFSTRAPHQAGELVGVHGLGDVVEGPFLQGLHGGVHGGVGGDHDHHQLGIEGVQAALQLEPVHAGELDVQEHHVVGRLLQPLQGLGGVLGGGRAVAVAPEPLLQRVPHGELVVHDEQARPLQARARAPRGGR
jgi:hypothetical protein